MLVENDQILAEVHEALAVDQVGLLNTRATADKRFDTLVIRGTGTPSAISAKNVYSSGRNLVHLVIGMDGNKIIQMTDFTRRVGTGFQFENTSILIGLVNVGYLLEDDSQKSHYRHVDNFAPDKRILARGVNDRKKRLWPCFPNEQLELLVQVAGTLMNHYGIRLVQTYEELNINALDPGPAFPMVSFIERLRQEVPNLGNRPMITRKSTKSNRINSAPSSSAHQIADSQIKKGALLTAVDESENWSLVEMIDDIEMRWRKGWVKSDEIELIPFEAAIREHLLETKEGAAFPYIPAGKGNYNARKDSNHPKYLVMHYTTGTQLQSTINTFRNSGNGVSTHLVIGRDGRVIQMVPFNQAAYHCGFGSWEGDRNLNNLTIGIELDNAGRLTNIDGKWTKRGHIVPDNRVEEALHWKDRNVRTYERFTDVQLEVALRVARALVNHYGLKDIIGHDEISLETRYDPGPLFPLAKWREILIGQKDPKVKKYITKTETEIFKDYEGIPPRLNHPLVPNIKLKNQQTIKQIIRVENPFTLIKVSKGSTPFIGWVESDAIKVLTQITKINKEKVEFYRRFADGGPPPIKHRASPLPKDTLLRVLKVEGDLALVVTLERLGNFPFIEGWVKRDLIEGVNP